MSALSSGGHGKSSTEFDIKKSVITAQSGHDVSWGWGWGGEDPLAS